MVILQGSFSTPSESVQPPVIIHHTHSPPQSKVDRALPGQSTSHICMYICICIFSTYTRIDIHICIYIYNNIGGTWNRWMPFSSSGCQQDVLSVMHMCQLGAAAGHLDGRSVRLGLHPRMKATVFWTKRLRVPTCCVCVCVLLYLWVYRCFYGPIFPM